LRGARHSAAGPPHALMITVTAYPSDSRILHEATALAAGGYRVSVICSAVGDQPLRERHGGVDVYRYRPRKVQPFAARLQTTAERDGRLQAPASGGRGLGGYVRAWGGSTLAILRLCLRVLARERVDVVHAHNPPDTLCVAALACKLAGARFVFDQHDVAPEMYLARTGDAGRPVLYRLLLLLERLSYRLADHVIATNRSYRELAAARGRVPRERISVVRNGPGVGELPAPRTNPTAADTVGFAGVIGLQDGVDHLVRAIHVLVHRLGRTGLRCVIVGAGDGLEPARRLANELGLTGHVTFTGWLPRQELTELLATVDVAVEPAPANDYSRRSTMIKVMEYMALGRPVVAFDMPEHRHTAQDAALYAKPNDDADLARCIARLLDDEAERERMGRLGRERVEGQLAWSHNAPRLLEAYRCVLRDGRAEA
jgi:glycosyltransferase involved in cell wall biosynthesis